MALAAYEELDLQGLEAVLTVLSSKAGVNGEDSVKSLKVLSDEITRLEKVINDLKIKITEIKTSYPYNKLEIIKDHLLLEKERKRLIEAIKLEEERLLFYEQRLFTMREGGNGGQIH
jgi:hypothetical protein